MKPIVQKLLITGLVLSLGLGPAMAQEPKMPRIKSVAVDVANGNILINVEDGAFDPLLRMEQAPNGDYRIIMEAENVTLDNAVKQQILKLNSELSKAIPAIESVNFMQLREDGVPVTRVIFDATGRLQPQVRSNTGNLITIALTGDKLGKPKPLVNPPAFNETDEEIGPSPEMPSDKSVGKSNKEPVKKIQATRVEIQDTPKAAATAKSKPAVKPVAASTKKPAAATTKTANQKTAAKTIVQEPPVLPSQTQPVLDMTPVNPPELLPQPQALPTDGPPDEMTFDPGSVSPWPIKLNSTPPGFEIVEEALPTPEPMPTPAPSKPAKATAKEPVIFKADFTPPKKVAAAPITVTPAAAAKTVSNQKFSLYEAVKNPSTDAVIRQAWTDLQRGEYAATEMALKTFLEQSPRNVLARYLLAQMYLGNFGNTANKRDLAASELEKIISLQENFQPAYQLLIPVYLQDQAYDKAERLLKKAMIQWPEDAQMLYYQGMLQEAMNNIGLAQNSYIDSLKANPDSFTAHYRLGLLAMKTNQIDMAKWELQQALQLSPGDPRVIRILGGLAEKENNLGIANSYYKEALQPDILINYARLLEARNERDKAMSIYTALETIAYDNPDVLFNLGMIYSSQKENKRAEVVMKRFLKLTEGSSDSRVEEARDVLARLR